MLEVVIMCISRNIKKATKKTCTRIIKIKKLCADNKSGDCQSVIS